MFSTLFSLSLSLSKNQGRAFSVSASSPPSPPSKKINKKWQRAQILSAWGSSCGTRGVIGSPAIFRTLLAFFFRTNVTLGKFPWWKKITCVFHYSSLTFLCTAYGDIDREVVSKPNNTTKRKVFLSVHMKMSQSKFGSFRSICELITFSRCQNQFCRIFWEERNPDFMKMITTISFWPKRNQVDFLWILRTEDYL